MRIIYLFSTSLTAVKNRVASEYSLHPIYKKEFHEVFTENQNDPEFKQLLIRMGVVDPQGESAMDEDQWDAASTSLLSLSVFHFHISSSQISILHLLSRSDNSSSYFHCHYTYVAFFFMLSSDCVISFLCPFFSFNTSSR